MKTVYFVRHGESDANVGNVYQGADSVLTARGREQAEYLAARCSKLPIDLVISSTMKRAQETADIICAEIGKPFDSSELFRERKRPSVLVGKSTDDPEAIALEKKWWESLAGDGTRVGDGENFADVCVRVGLALEYLIGRPEKHILVVSHGFFLRMFVARALFGPDIKPLEMRTFMLTFVMENTGITILRHKAAAAKPGEPLSPEWRLWVWNDYAHLG